MGCSNSKSTTATDDSTTATATRPSKMTDITQQEYPASEAFTIPLDDDININQLPVQLNDTLRDPPKRLQRLLQLAAETEPPTLQELEEKQQRAEQRRQELMQLKVETIQKNTQMLMRLPGEQEPGEEQESGSQQPAQSTHD